MTNKVIRETLKKHGETVITPSIYWGDKSEGKVIFETYDNTTGIVYSYFVNFTERYATCKQLSSVLVHDTRDASSMFFN